MSMLEELRDMLQSIPDSRAVIVVHPDDEQSVRLAADAIAVIAPRIVVNRWARSGEAIVFPDPSASKTIVP